MKKKVCFVASSGGHFEQLMMLKPLMEKYDGFIMTEKTTYKSSGDKIRTYYLKQVNRKEVLFPFLFLYDFVYSLVIFMKEKPDYVISTGALATIPICLITKLFGKKMIFIESFAKVDSPTLTGKLLYRFADRFYVQWEPMLKIYPNAIYLGGIY